MRSTDMSAQADKKQKFLFPSEQDRKEILQTLGNRRGQSPAILEKDLFHRIFMGRYQVSFHLKGSKRLSRQRRLRIKPSCSLNNDDSLE